MRDVDKPILEELNSIDKIRARLVELYPWMSLENADTLSEAVYDYATQHCTVEGILKNRDFWRQCDSRFGTFL